MGNMFVRIVPPFPQASGPVPETGFRVSETRFRMILPARLPAVLPGFREPVKAFPGCWILLGLEPPLCFQLVELIEQAVAVGPTLERLLNTGFLKSPNWKRWVIDSER
jgi:hypothetical protein